MRDLLRKPATCGKGGYRWMAHGIHAGGGADAVR